MPVISISPYKIINGIKHTWDRNAGPGEFLFYVSNADYIITNSFHCSVFSVLYNKQFCVIKHATRNSRIENLMSISGIQNKIIDNIVQIDSVLREKIDYTSVNRNIEKQRLLGEEYLVQALND